MHCIFVQIRCRPGTTYAVADALVLKELHSELYSTSGDWDLLLKAYVPEERDIGRFVAEMVGDVADIERTLTTMTFKTLG
ncbi:Lrp/AsnC ligand binding domain-containing protein [Jannaschia sp. Os4]|uniref:Lrp/AsnC ligand binding domain-containing protein n=1 Tax=Jannaschia sp. Os4 TaxID=2807617 RepID=UPI0019392DD7|nr:Lrp/AsnC ligand binding domain-containing protein [Jannaschia sp. Os4]MBM2575492.1 Lrp/AsnC ligand binding domain-containing protein [Jannaschia sp. Os4]